MDWMAICRVKGCEWERREHTEARAHQVGASHERERPGHKVTIVQGVADAQAAPRERPRLTVPFAWEHMQN